MGGGGVEEGWGDGERDRGEAGRIERTLSRSSRFQIPVSNSMKLQNQSLGNVPKKAWGQVRCGEVFFFFFGSTRGSTGANITSFDSVGKYLRSLSPFGSVEPGGPLASLRFTRIT